MQRPLAGKGILADGGRGVSGMGQDRGGEDVAGYPVASVLQTPAFFVVCQGHLSWGSKGDGHDAGLHGRWRFHLAFS